MTGILLTPDQARNKYQQLKRKYEMRDSRMRDVKAVRDGEIELVFPDLASEAWQKPIIANFIDTVAHDLSEVIAPLPSFGCSSGTMATDVAKKFADKRTKIAHHYIEKSRLATQMFTSADQLLTYGFTVFRIEPDFDERVPRVVVEDAMGGYPEWDRFGRLVSYTKVTCKPAWQLAQEYPELRGKFIRDPLGTDRNREIELVYYCDDMQHLLMALPDKEVVLSRAANRVGRVPVVVACRPTLQPQGIAGQFDDVIWVQAARARMAALHMEAVEKSVQAPLAMPRDALEIGLGADGIIRTESPEKIRRVGVDMPQAAAMESQVLNQEMREGSRYPVARQGSIEASVVTGRGIQELMGGFDTQVKTAQEILRPALADVIALLFATDEAFWPNTSRTIRGAANGTPFEITYKPSKDLAGDYSCDVTYGFAAGLDPNRALVLMLQLRAEKAISRELMQRHLPFDIDVSEEISKVDIEETRDALKQAIFGLVQAIPATAQMGQDPSHVLGQVSAIIRALQKGKPIEDAVTAAMAPPKPPPGASVPADATAGQGKPGSAPGGDLPPGMNASGLLQGVAPGQAGLPPGGRPDLKVALAGLSSGGNPNLSSYVRRTQPA